MPFDVLTPEFLFLIAVAAAAGVLRGYTGFGSAMVIAPLWSMVIGPQQMVATLMVLELAVSFQLLPRALKNTDWRLIGLLVTSALVAIPLGIWALVTLDPTIVRRIIGLVVLVWAGSMIVGLRYDGRASTPITLLVGATSGVLMGCTGLGGPPILIYLLASAALAESNRANIIVYFAFVTVFLIGAYAWEGFYQPAVLWRAGIVAPLFLVCAWIGANLFDRTSEAMYRRVALYSLLAIGAVTLAS